MDVARTEDGSVVAMGTRALYREGWAEAIPWSSTAIARGGSWTASEVYMNALMRAEPDDNDARVCFGFAKVLP